MYEFISWLCSPRSISLFSLLFTINQSDSSFSYGKVEEAVLPWRKSTLETDFSIFESPWLIARRPPLIFSRSSTRDFSFLTSSAGMLKENAREHAARYACLKYLVLLQEHDNTVSRS